MPFGDVPTCDVDEEGGSWNDYTVCDIDRETEADIALRKKMGIEHLSEVLKLEKEHGNNWYLEGRSIMPKKGDIWQSFHTGHRYCIIGIFEGKGVGIMFWGGNAYTPSRVVPMHKFLKYYRFHSLK